MIAAAGMSVRNLNRRFLAATGMSPRQYLRRVRIEAAKRLLEAPNAPIDRVAGAVGYARSPAPSSARSAWWRDCRPANTAGEFQAS